MDLKLNDDQHLINFISDTSNIIDQYQTHQF